MFKRLNSYAPLYKKQIAFIVSLAITLLVVFGWANVYDNHSMAFIGDMFRTDAVQTHQNTETKSTEPQQERTQMSSPFEAIRNDIGTISELIGDAWSGIIGSLGTVQYTNK